MCTFLRQNISSTRFEDLACVLYDFECGSKKSHHPSNIGAGVLNGNCVCVYQRLGWSY